MSTQCQHCYTTFFTYMAEEQHACPVLAARKTAEEIGKRQIVIQLPDNPGAEYDDLLIAMTMLAQKLAKDRT